MAMEHEYQLANRVEVLEDASFAMANQIEVLRGSLRECVEHIESISRQMTPQREKIVRSARKILSGEYGI